MSEMKIGVWSLISSLEVLNLLIHSGSDFIVIDLEHGSWEKKHLSTAVKLCESAGQFSIIRVCSPEIKELQIAFDCYPNAIQISGMNEMNDYLQLIKNGYLRPTGNLGFSPWTRAGLRLAETSIYKSPKLIPQVETRKSLDEFMMLPPDDLSYFFGVFLGRYDLSVDLGCPGDIANKSVMDALKELSSFSQSHNLEFMTVSNSYTDSKHLEKIGVKWISLGSDHTRLMSKPRE